jgi:hypothetical protein
MARRIMDHPNRGYFSEQMNNVVPRLDHGQQLWNAASGFNRRKRIELLKDSRIRCKKLCELGIQAAHKNFDRMANMLPGAYLKWHAFPIVVQAVLILGILQALFNR